MEELLEKVAPILETKMVPIVDALEKADATSKEYTDLLTAFNSTMVVYSQLQELFIRRALAAQKEEEVINVEEDK